MKVTVFRGATFTHHLPDAPGPEGRPHEHPFDFYFDFDVPMDPKTGLTIAFGDLQQLVDSIFLGIPRDINAIPGIHPTMESLAGYLRERFLYVHSAAVRVYDPHRDIWVEA